ncbi:hypothetical protein HF324_16805 [Chitinophaga oryzae]|uniref:Uncharacterized protein n=1 Tax=Chitinophaga oryzae TaxID=2725414 RepID=A0ABX6LHD2_9BACT|nr:hypothetical protein [Chitinophaga oryzae]QJB39426.1 hypothetical protein HF324_16805 [Chitinophaga oryzae]
MTKTAFGLSIASIAWLAMSCGQHHENKPAAAAKTVVEDSGRTIKLPPTALPCISLKHRKSPRAISTPN